MPDLSLAVCPHDTIRNTEGWFRLVQFLSPRLGVAVHFNPSLDFEDFHSTFSAADLVYANPSDAIKLIDQHGFSPLACPQGIFDEALVVASCEVAAPKLEHLSGADLAVVEGMLPTRLGLRLLQRKGIAAGALIGHASWLGVMSSLWRNELSYGIVYRDAYEELSAEGKAMLQVVATTDEHAAFHMLCAGPELATQRAVLTTLLLSMAEDSNGKLVLGDMHFSGWTSVTTEALSRLRSIFN